MNSGNIWAFTFYNVKNSTLHESLLKSKTYHIASVNGQKHSPVFPFNKYRKKTCKPCRKESKTVVIVLEVQFSEIEMTEKFLKSFML